MPLDSIIDGLCSAAGVAAVAAFFVLEYSPDSGLGRLLLKYLQQKPRNLGALNSRPSLGVDEFALIEKFIPNLHSVVIVCNMVDHPTRELAGAVLDNFQQGAKYMFFVSADGNPDGELLSYYNWFHAIYETARGIAPDKGENATIHNMHFDTLFSIRRLPLNWPHVPYVFYTYKSEGDDLITIALKGTTRGVGISKEYLRVDQTEAISIFDLCAAASKEFRLSFGAAKPSVDGALPDTAIREAQRDDPSVVPFSRPKQVA